MRLFYVADARIPSEKAHPYQIMQMCEAFAAQGAEVTLLYPNRANEPKLNATDIWGYYGVERNFVAERLFTLDLHPFAVNSVLDWIAARLSTLTFTLAVAAWLVGAKDGVIYSRDPIVLTVLALLFPGRTLFFEAHSYPASRIGEAIRRCLLPRISGLIVTTDKLRERYEAIGAESIRVAHDAIRVKRFDIEGDQVYWRERVGWSVDAFIVGYVGRFNLIGIDKGVGMLAQAAAVAANAIDDPLYLALLGSPASFVEQLPHQEMILYPGHVPAEEVPGYLAAFDVCVLPSPFNEYLAYYTSPLKLFEYMASGRPVIATDLPAFREIITHGENGLLVPPDDVEAMAAAICNLHAQPQRAAQLAQQARQDVYTQHTWDKRARRILDMIL